MSDLKSLSDDELSQLLQQMQQQQDRAYMEHTIPSARTPDYLLNQNNPLYGSTIPQRLRIGIGRGMANVGRHAGNLVGLVPDESIAESNRLDAPLMDTGAGKIGSMIGETAPLVPLTMGASSALGATGKLGEALVNNPISNGAFQGALQGGLMADPGKKLTGTTIGGITGATIPTITGLFGKLLRGVNRTPEAQQLLDEGVRLTPGQMNPEGVTNKIEENMRGWPVVGNVIEKARNQAEGDFKRKVIQAASAPGTTLQTTGNDVNELFQEAQKSYKPFYAAAEGFPVTPEIHNVGSNQPLIDALIKSANSKGAGATRASREQAQDFLEGQFEAIMDKAKSAGGMTSDHLIQLRSNINEEIRGAGYDNAGKAYAKLLRSARDKVTEALESQLPPEATASLKVANDAYPKLAIIRDAIKRGGDQPNGFTPAQLSQAVKSATENNEYAQGGGMLRDWSSAGRDIFTQRNPHTGSALTTGALLATAAAHSPYITIPAAGAGLGLIGTNAGRNFLSGQTGWQEGARKLFDSVNPNFAPETQSLLRSISGTALSRAFANSERGRSALSAPDRRALVEALMNTESP